MAYSHMQAYLLFVHRDQLRAQRSVTSMGSLYILYFYVCLLTYCRLQVMQVIVFERGFGAVCFNKCYYV